MARPYRTDPDLDRARFAPSPESDRADDEDVNMDIPSRFTYEPESPRSDSKGSDSEDEDEDDMEIDEISNVSPDVDMWSVSDGEQMEIDEEMSTARPQVGGEHDTRRNTIHPVPKKRNMAPFSRDWIGGEVEDYLGKPPYMRPHARWKKGTEPDLRPKPKYGGGKKDKPKKKLYAKPVRKAKFPRVEDKDRWNGRRDKNYLPDSIPFTTLPKVAGLDTEELWRSQVQEGRPKATEVSQLMSLGELVGHLHISIPAPKDGGVQNLRVGNLQNIIPRFWPARLVTTDDHICFDFGTDPKRERAAWCLYEALLVAFAYTVKLIGFDGKVLAFRKKGPAVPEYHDRVVAFKERCRGKKVENAEHALGYRRMPDHERKRDFAREREYEQRCNREREPGREGDYHRGQYYDRGRSYEHRPTYDRDREVGRGHRRSYDYQYSSTPQRPRYESKPHFRKQEQMAAPRKVKNNLDLEKPLPRKRVAHGEELLNHPRPKPNVKATFRWPAVPDRTHLGKPEKTSIWGYVQNVPNTTAYWKKATEDREDDEDEAPIVVDVVEKFGKDWARKNQAYAESVPDSPESHLNTPSSYDSQRTTIYDPHSPIYIASPSPTIYGVGSEHDSMIVLPPSYSPIEPEFSSPSEGDDRTDENENEQGGSSPSLVVFSPTRTPNIPAPFDTNSDKSPEIDITSLARGDLDGDIFYDAEEEKVISPRKRKMDDREEESFGPLRGEKEYTTGTSPSQPAKKRIRYTEDSSDNEILPGHDDGEDLMTPSVQDPKMGSPTKRKRDDRARSVEGLRKIEHEGDDP